MKTNTADNEKRYVDNKVLAERRGWLDLPCSLAV